jgi:hypothetical protein
VATETQPSAERHLILWTEFLGRSAQHYDEVGVAASLASDFKGNFNSDLEARCCRRRESPKLECRLKQAWQSLQPRTVCAERAMSIHLFSAGKQIAESFAAYEEGKHRRYSLLFQVNGGAFAIVKLFVDSKLLTNPTEPVLGKLSLRWLSVGMILFTIVMTFDIFKFGEKMHNYDKDTFRTTGKIVLALLGVLICAGWFFAAGGQDLF